MSKNLGTIETKVDSKNIRQKELKQANMRGAMAVCPHRATISLEHCICSAKKVESVGINEKTKKMK